MKSLSEISNEMRDLAERARKRRLAPHEYQGGTTSISNLGMYGIKNFDAVINPPHATILAVGAAERRPVVSGEALEAATVMNVTLSCDHRVVDGATGRGPAGRLPRLHGRPRAHAGLAATPGRVNRITPLADGGSCSGSNVWPPGHAGAAFPK